MRGVCCGMANFTENRLLMQELHENRSLLDYIIFILDVSTNILIVTILYIYIYIYIFIYIFLIPGP